MLASQRRKEHLINELQRKGVYVTLSNRPLTTLSLAELEWLHIETVNVELREEVQY